MLGLRRYFGKVSSDQIRLLRDMTGAPLLQCKTVLTECDGDLDKAKQALREKNLLFADKKAGANSGQGVIFRYIALGFHDEHRPQACCEGQPQCRD